MADVDFVSENARRMSQQCWQTIHHKTVCTRPPGGGARPASAALTTWSSIAWYRMTNCSAAVCRCWDLVPATHSSIRWDRRWSLLRFAASAYYRASGEFELAAKTGPSLKGAIVKDSDAGPSRHPNPSQYGHSREGRFWPWNGHPTSTPCNASMWIGLR